MTVSNIFADLFSNSRLVEDTLILFLLLIVGYASTVYLLSRRYKKYVKEEDFNATLDLIKMELDEIKAKAKNEKEENLVDAVIKLYAEKGTPENISNDELEQDYVVICYIKDGKLGIEELENLNISKIEQREEQRV